MHTEAFRSRLRALAVLAATVLALTAVACGDDDDEGGGEGDAQQLTITVADKGKNQSTLKAPASAESGLVEITLQNDGKRSHDAQLFRVAGNQTAQQVVGALGQGRSARGTACRIGCSPPAASGRPRAAPRRPSPRSSSPGPTTSATSTAPRGRRTRRLCRGSSSAARTRDAELPDAPATVTRERVRIRGDGLTAGRTQSCSITPVPAPPHRCRPDPARQHDRGRAGVRQEREGQAAGQLRCRRRSPPCSRADEPAGDAGPAARQLRAALLHLRPPGRPSRTLAEGMISEAKVE